MLNLLSYFVLLSIGQKKMLILWFGFCNEELKIKIRLMMKTIKNAIPILVTFCLLHYSASLFSQTVTPVPEGIFSSLKAGNSKELCKFFNANIELVILDKEGVYSKNQSEIILRDFFVKNIPNNYIKLHEGGKDASKYVIGRLSTSKGQYRIVFLMKNNKGAFCIHQFRIEDDN